jgi:hypothetical protein
MLTPVAGGETVTVEVLDPPFEIKAQICGTASYSDAVGRHWQTDWVWTRVDRMIGPDQQETSWSTSQVRTRPDPPPWWWGG